MPSLCGLSNLCCMSWLAMLAASYSCPWIAAPWHLLLKVFSWSLPNGQLGLQQRPPPWYWWVPSSEPAHQCVVLGLGPLVFLQEIKAPLLPPRQVFVYSVDFAFDQDWRRDFLRCYARWSIEHILMGLSSTVVAHTDCRGVTLAVHYLCFCLIRHDGLVEVPCVPCCLTHIINAAEKSDVKGWWLSVSSRPRVPSYAIGRDRGEEWA